MKQAIQRLNSPLLATLIVAVVYFIYLTILLIRFNFNPAYLISLGEKFADLKQLPNNLVVWKNYGYDGQFYYRLALNPFTSKKEEFGITIDIPSYRQQRIIYPFLTWIFSLGQKDFVPAVLLLVNFAALLMIGFIGSHFAKSLNLHSLWGLIFVIHPGFPYILSRDLTEILQTFFLLSSLLFVKTHRYLSSALLLTLAILTRETALVVAVSLLFTFKSRYFLIPIVCYAVWQLILFLNWGQTPILLANLNLGFSFSGIISYLRYTLGFATYPQQLGFIQLSFLLIFVIAVFNAFISSKAAKFIKIAWMLYLVMALLYTSYIWVADIAFFRALTEFYMLGAVILLSSKSKIRNFVFLLTLVIWLLSIKQFGYF